MGSIDDIEMVEEPDVILFDADSPDGEQVFEKIKELNKIFDEIRSFTNG